MMNETIEHFKELLDEGYSARERNYASGRGHESIAVIHIVGHGERIVFTFKGDEVQKVKQILSKYDSKK